MLVDEIRRWGVAMFTATASAHALESCEAKLGQSLPDQLRLLLSATDGVQGEYGLGLVWTAQRIADDNVGFRSSADFRELYMPFDGLVFFADAGNGDQFAISLMGSQEIYVWNHENDSRTWVAPTVMRYLENRMTGALEV